MNLNEYIKSRTEDVHTYLRDINYENLESENAIEGLPEAIDLMFNKNPVYRKETDMFVLAIRNAYDYLLEDKLEFASNENEVEAAIHEFESKLKDIIKKFKNSILKIFSKETGYKVNIINNDLSFIQIKVRKREGKLNPEELHNQNELNGFKEIFSCIFALISMIKDKRIKSENLLDIINAKYKVGSPEYTVAMGKYMEILNEQNYDEFLKLYTAEMKRLKIGDEEADKLSNRPKSRG